MPSLIAGARRGLKQVAAPSALFSSRLVPLVVTLVAARRIDTASLGRLSLALVAMTLAATVSDWGTSQWSLTTPVSQHSLPIIVRTRIWPAVTCGVSVAIFCHLTQNFSTADLASIFLASLGAIYQGSAYISYGRHDPVLRTGALAATEYMPPVLILLVLPGISPIISIALGRVVGMICSWQAMSRSRPAYRLDVDFLDISDFGIFSASLVIASGFANFSDAIALSIFSTAADLGLYRYALVLVAPLSLLGGIAGVALQRLYAVRLRSCQGVKVTPAILIISLLGLAFVIPAALLRGRLLALVAGMPVSGLSFVVVVLLAANLLGIMAQPLTTHITARFGARRLWPYGLMTSAATFSTSFIGAGLAGMDGAAVGPLIGYLLGLLLQARFLRRMGSGVAK